MSVLPFVPAQAGTNEIAYEDIMINAAEYRAMASEHHRLAGMCRSPESRERHFRLEKELLALANMLLTNAASRSGAGDER